ncbi:MAG: type II toxin-antitoxin system RelB/DinJ family antitoxin [Ruminococcus sp.]|nr:type II toxin-antitoxin system RelB/DinJ family antitoxin [Ruminococcus sp.]
MTQVNFRIDEDVKAKAESALNDMGLTMSTVITMFLTKVGRERRISFEITDDPFYSKSNMRYLEQMMSDVKSGKAHFAEHELIEADD